jgi:hypothetical protein
VNLPIEFLYEKASRELTVKWGNGEIKKYFDIDPRLAFLDKTNQRRSADFIAFLANGRNHKPGCWLEQPNQKACVCPAIVSEIQEADSEKLPEPQTRPLLVQQQSGEHK